MEYELPYAFYTSIGDKYFYKRGPHKFILSDEKYNTLYSFINSVSVKYHEDGNYILVLMSRIHKINLDTGLIEDEDLSEIFGNLKLS